MGHDLQHLLHFASLNINNRLFFVFKKKSIVLGLLNLPEMVDRLVVNGGKFRRCCCQVKTELRLQAW
jgi:hypothetical protein